MSSSGSPFDWRGIVCLCLFLITNVIVMFPLHLHVPFPKVFLRKAGDLLLRIRILTRKEDVQKTRDASPRGLLSGVYWLKITFNFQSAPLLAVLFLLSTTVIDPSTVRTGIVGENGVQPLNVMALFISLAYLSISLDATGLFQFLAFWVARKGGSSGRKLFLLLYTFFFTSGAVVGNDPVILSGTAFLVYFTKISGIIPPTAWFFAQFVAANIASAVLPPSNPTNLVITGAFSITFVKYTARTVLPALAAAIFTYILLILFIFKSRELVPKTIDLQDLQTTSRSARSAQRTSPMPGSVTDKNGALIGCILLASTLIVLVATSPLGVSVWKVTIPPALAMAVRDIWHDRNRFWPKRQFHNSRVQEVKEPESEVYVMRDITMKAASESVPSEEVDIGTGIDRHQRPSLESMLLCLRRDVLPTLCTIVPRLPISLIPFALSMFVLVQALTDKGWIQVFSKWWDAWISVCGRNGTGGAVAGAVAGMLLISTVLCNICGTNIGAAILLSRLLQDWLQSSQKIIDPKVRTGSIFALALGTNIGAFSFTFSASLAGLLWRDILRQKGIIVHQRQFFMLNLPIVATAMLAAGATIVAEVYVVP